MENAVKALEMAAGVMLGVILMALVAYFFTNISSWPQNEEDVMSVEQLAKFNLEYDVYNKSQMYGVDVISCLNKVVSNNEKYAEGGAFLGGNASLGDYKQRENYWINVKIKLKTGTKLKENLKMFYCNDNNKEQERLSDESINNKIVSVSINNAGLKKLNSAITKVGENYTNFKGDTEIKHSIYDQEVEVFKDREWIIGGYINLIYRQSDGNVSDMNPNLTELLNSIQTLSNDQGTANLTYTVINTTKKDYRTWTTITWETVLHDLKSRKFTCTSYTINDTTGRVNEIVFEEI